MDNFGLRLGRLLAVVLGVWSLCANAGSAANWPQWRGPNASGIPPDEDYPTEWSTEKNILWKTEIPGQGHSSPIVWGDRIFLTSAVEGDSLDRPQAIQHLLEGQEFTHPDWTGSDHLWTLKLISLDRRSGKILWERTVYEGKVYDHRHRMNTYASGTPVTDGRRVYAYFGPEGLYCYDFAGNLVWKKSLGGIGTMGMGNGTSPVLHDGKVIIVADQEFDGADSFLTALDMQTGEEVWRVKRDNRATWATPLVIESGGKTELVVAGAEHSVSYDPSKGSEIWRAPGLVSHAIPSPLSDGENVYLSAGSQDKRAMAVRLGGRGDLTDSTHILWQYNKGTAYVPSPILYRGHLYLMTDKGVITCLNARSGEVIYEGGRMPKPATFKASPVAFGGKIFFTSEDGDTHVVKAGPEFEVIRTNSLNEPVWASPALADGKIYIRGSRHLFAIGSAETGAVDVAQ